MVTQAKQQILLQRLADRRSKRVVFLAHCLLNANTRYLGGAGCGGCVRAVVEPCLAANLGLVQMPCPEQGAWGGVLKRRLLTIYGAQGTWWYRGRRLLLPLLLIYTRWIYRRLAGQIAAQIQDYRACGYRVCAVVGIDSSPSCGVRQTLDVLRSFERLARLDVQSVTVAQMTDLIRDGQTPGSGLFITALQRELARRHLTVPFLAHDLLAELAGRPANLPLPPGGSDRLATARQDLGSLAAQ